MMREKSLSALTGTVLGMLLAIGSIGCLLSAFGLAMQNPAAVWGAVFLFGAMYALCLQWKQGSLVYACVLALAAGYLLRFGTAAEEAKRLLQHLSRVYDRAYHWGILQFEGVSPEGSVDLPPGILAVLIVLAAVRTVFLQKSCWLPVLLALVPPAACVVVTDTVPDEKSLFILLAAIILLILPASVRRENRLQGIRLTAAAVLPVLLGLGILFYAVPQNSYVNHSAVIQENLRTAVNHLPQLMEEGLESTASRVRGTSARTVDLSRLGNRIPFTYPVMEVTAENSGTLYLRGQDYDCYDGFGWTASENRQEDFSRQEEDAQVLSIRTHTARPLLYLPYYPAESALLTGGSTQNTQRKTEYTFSASGLPEGWRETVCSSTEDAAEDLTAYLSLPDAAREGAEIFLAHSYRPGASNTEKADLIAALVTDCAAYSLTPSRMPEGQADFALWFLTAADTGYCIHFATAATVLLRAAGVPARYVTGYMTQVISGETVTVTEADAHAWAEYFEPRLSCWIPLEATPAATADDITPVTTPDATTTASTVSETLPEFPETAPTPVPAAPREEPTLTAEESRDFLPLLLLLPLPLLLFPVQRSVRLHLRRRRQHSGTTNDQALQRFREAERLARLLKETPAEELIDLAQKAKYSQHEITLEELQHFDSYCRSCLRRLKEKPLYRQLIYRYFHAAY